MDWFNVGDKIRRMRQNEDRVCRSVAGASDECYKNPELKEEGFKPLWRPLWMGCTIPKRTIFKRLDDKTGFFTFQ